jgi:DNA repair protein RadC
LELNRRLSILRNFPSVERGIHARLRPTPRLKIPLAYALRLPFHDRVKPGRALLELGAGNCSDAQLLAILLGSGGRGFSALDSANALLEKYGTLGGLMNRSLVDVAQIRGIKVVRAIRLAAAFEICQRLLKEADRDFS